MCGGETKKSRYIGEEWVRMWRRKKKRKRKKDIEGHACIDSSKLFFETKISTLLSSADVAYFVVGNLLTFLDPYFCTRICKRKVNKGAEW